ncbi:branched-chain alpha-keto acid dehydrogenase subunit E2 [Cohnella kolymensis]|uniref:Dihydrolipoamide acetyltransferase component of pyruvate dehydrogenase complex n=1 Tax=Cohnella kolymensis TaxID=1590652 RepID=A0ABR4ZZE3_9BACL|nr:dihydrolipoamide acetyltransferase family protein [Cohnella kolymensis]KIL34189.1 branched-chain alpha-keto acid dehydrogenase subunit E2 [Cohnella kolymensis]
MENEEHGTEVTLPHLAESLVSATVGRWLKQPGDYVQEYEVLCELITDKVNVEMPSPMEGTLTRILVQEGDIADVGAAICLIRGSDSANETPVEPAKAATQKKDKDEADQRTRYSPAVLSLAEENRIDLRKVQGTSLGGRISRKDVLAYIMNNLDSKPAASPESKPEEKAAPANRVVPENASDSRTEERKEPAASMFTAEDQIVPVSPIRKMIAQRMLQSVSEIPHAWLMIEADVSGLVALREKVKESFAAKEGVRLTVTPFVLKAVVNAIKEYPMLNSTWAEDNIIVKKDIHVSIAVGSEESVVTPVIRNADRKTIAGLAIEMEELIAKARNGKLTLSDMQGGTFTFNNTGSFGSVLSVPIINYPQAAIITLESIVRKPVVVNHDSIAIRSMANLCLSLDHRILDGKICGLFIQRVKQYLEKYDENTVIY